MLKKKDDQRFHFLNTTCALLDRFSVIPLMNLQGVAQGESNLHFAVLFCRGSIVKKLLELPRIGVNIKSRSGDAPLHLAVQRCRRRVVSEFVKVPDINVNIVDYNGNSPLHIAVDNNCEGIMKLLVKILSVKLDIKNKKGETPLHRAALQSNEKLVKRLLKISVLDGSEKSFSGQTPLHLAATNPNKKVMRALLNYLRHDINKKTKSGYTPLHVAVFFDNWPVVSMLLRRGAEVNALDNKDDTPLDLLSQQVDERFDFDPNRRIYRLLKRAGAKTFFQLNASTEKNYTVRKDVKNFTVYDYGQIPFFVNGTPTPSFISREFLLPSVQNISVLSDNSNALVRSSTSLYVGGLFFMMVFIALVSFLARYCKRKIFSVRQVKSQDIELQQVPEAGMAALSP